MRSARRPGVFPPGRDQTPARIDEFNFPRGAVQAKHRDDLGRGDIEAPAEGIAVMPAEVPEALDLGLFRAYVAATHGVPPGG